MSKPSLYAITSREVEPVSDLLRAVVEVNWHLALAEAAGWLIHLAVNDQTRRLGVSVDRAEPWPTPETEEVVQ